MRWRICEESSLYVEIKWTWCHRVLGPSDCSPSFNQWTSPWCGSKIVCNHFSQVNSTQKCLWILWKQFKFTLTKKMKLSYFTSIKNTLQILQLCHFSILLLVNIKNAVYNHVVVIWQGRIIDYESKNIYIWQMNLYNKSVAQIRFLAMWAVGMDCFLLQRSRHCHLKLQIGEKMITMTISWQ
jgi:hypothetical protein